jgi:hypothetical protein
MKLMNLHVNHVSNLKDAPASQSVTSSESDSDSDDSRSSGGSVNPNECIEDADVCNEDDAQLLQSRNDDCSGDEVSVGSKGRDLVEVVVCARDSEDVARVVDRELDLVEDVVCAEDSEDVATVVARECQSSIDSVSHIY